MTSIEKNEKFSSNFSDRRGDLINKTEDKLITFTDLPYFEVYQKYQQIDNLLDNLHYTKIAKEDLTDDQRENGIFVITEFCHSFNKEFSELLGVKITLNISSHKWKKLYSDKDQKLPTVTGIFNK